MRTEASKKRIGAALGGTRRAKTVAEEDAATPGAISTGPSSSGFDRLGAYLDARRESGADGISADPPKVEPERANVIDTLPVASENFSPVTNAPASRGQGRGRRAAASVPQDVRDASETLAAASPFRAKFVVKVYEKGGPGRSDRHLFDLEGLTEDEFTRVESVVKQRLREEGTYPRFDMACVARSSVIGSDGRPHGKASELPFTIPGSEARTAPPPQMSATPVAGFGPQMQVPFMHMPYPGQPMGFNPFYPPQPQAPAVAAAPANDDRLRRIEDGMKSTEAALRVAEERAARAETALIESRAESKRLLDEERHNRELAQLKADMAASAAETARRMDAMIAAMKETAKPAAPDAFATAIAALGPVVASAVAAFTASAKERGASEAESRKEMIALFTAMQTQNQAQLQTMVQSMANRGQDAAATASLIQALSSTSLQTVGAMGEIMRAQMEASGSNTDPAWVRLLENASQSLLPILGAFALGVKPDAAAGGDAAADVSEDGAGESAEPAKAVGAPEPQKQLAAPAPAEAPATAKRAAPATAKTNAPVYPGFVVALRKAVEAQDPTKAARVFVNWFQAARMAEVPEPALVGFEQEPMSVATRVIGLLKMEKGNAEFAALVTQELDRIIQKMMKEADEEEKQDEGENDEDEGSESAGA